MKKLNEIATRLKIAKKKYEVSTNEKSDYFLNMNTKSDMSRAEKILSSKSSK